MRQGRSPPPQDSESVPVVADGYKGCLRDAEILQAVGTATLQLA
ncbi:MULTISPECIES: hypothetical protein [unclassified Chroococcidiopsis]|nr:hypothetical protein [Chroococcidiopsis sp. SAG 2025]